MSLVVELRNQLADIKEAIKKTVEGICEARDACRDNEEMEGRLLVVYSDALDAFSKIVKLQNDL